ncbi:hypothetical protein RND81_12G106500 [Saponaria officinalis]|uniref:Leucine-rich repeat-containing N-terminal plant-type domain-containing protein n=1 Tax=Saponaria officinalis TaxID=3572 RepID=A0AAW1H901_SAPOF
MGPKFPTGVYCHLLGLLFSAWITYCSGYGGSLKVTNSGVQCVESERAALLQFKHGIQVDKCGLLDSWGDGPDCCQWHGIQCNNHSGHIISLHLRGSVIILHRHGYSGPDYNNYKGCLEGTLGHSLLELKHLKFLDLSFNHFTGRLPKFIGSLSNLEHLNLSHAGFKGIVPQEIGNLSQLSSLDLNCHLSYGDSNVRVDSFRWISHLRLLKKLDLSGIDLNVATTTWLPIVNNLPFLQVLRLDGCHLSLKLPSSLSYINSSSTINVVSLSYNNMNDTSIFEWLINLKGLNTSLVYLDFSYNQMFGNNIQVTEPAINFIGSLCSLQNLDMSNTNLYYDFSDIIHSFSVCSYKSLTSLNLNLNYVWGSIPTNINTLSSIRELLVGDNQLKGTISQALWGLSMLEVLDLSSNSLKGVITDDHLSNLSKLSWLILGDNTEVVVNISANWIPPFQLDILLLDSCKVGPNFPMWLITQKYLTGISLSNNGIFDTVPNSFINSLSSKLKYLDMSKNMMYGILPDVSITFDSPSLFVDLSSNNFYGAIPSFLRNVTSLYLNNNSLSQGLVPLLCPQNKMPLVSLDLSNNLFSDKFPDCWGYFDNLQNLNLQNNKLWGSLPTSIGALDKLTNLHLSNNSISSELPSSLLNCKSLIILELSHNSLNGHITSTFWDSFRNLSILTLRNNNFIGTLPSSFCHLSQIRSLDLSTNHFSGTIPRCIYNLQGMANTQLSVFDNHFDGALIMWKRKEQLFTGHYSLGKARAIDFSNNRLEGQIPEGIASLIGLVSINLSRNHLSGAIALNIGQLTSLESLDLSHNELSSKIPTSLAKITALSTLDLSYNNLSGKIPTGPQLQTFDYSSYMGNPELCGAPLPKCEGDEAATVPQNRDNAAPHNEHHLDDFMLGLYISVVLGLIIGFWGVCGTLLLKRTWRHAFFRFYDNMKDRIYVIVVVHVARVWRRT